MQLRYKRLPQRLRTGRLVSPWLGPSSSQEQLPCLLRQQGNRTRLKIVFGRNESHLDGLDNHTRWRCLAFLALLRLRREDAGTTRDSADADGGGGGEIGDRIRRALEGDPEPEENGENGDRERGRRRESERCWGRVEEAICATQVITQLWATLT